MDPEILEQHKLLLEREKEAEMEQHDPSLPHKVLQRRGTCIRGVVVSKASQGPMGTVLLRFCKQSGGDLPPHKFSTGDILLIPSKDISGVVSSVRSSHITLSVDTDSPSGWWESLGLCSLIKVANQVFYQRCSDALESISKFTFPLRDVILGKSPPGARTVLKGALDDSLAHLNPLQRLAVQQSLEEPHLFLLQGPPGTGKTTTLVQIIQSLVESGKRVLAVAPSNTAVDNLAERLLALDRKWDLCRIGHAARLLPSVVQHSLHVLADHSDQGQLAKDVRKELQASLPRNEVKQLRKELKQREKRALDHVLSTCRVVLCTTVGSCSRSLYSQDFDVVVVDEAAQALESEVWIPILRALPEKLILVGDHKQLPPTLTHPSSTEIAEKLGFTLFERLIDKFGDHSVMLHEQYRMHECIMGWSSSMFYDGKLVAHPSVGRRLLGEIPAVEKRTDTVNPLILVDTAGHAMYEMVVEDLDGMSSKSNQGEVDIVTKVLQQYLDFGLSPDDIAIITPYRGQVKALYRQVSSSISMAIADRVEIGTVDGFQGREKELVLVSMVRSNEEGEVGFLSQSRRLNVALSRARRCMFVVCNSETLCSSGDDYLCSFVEYCTRFADYRNVNMYLDESYRVSADIEEYIHRDVSSFEWKSSQKRESSQVKNSSVKKKKKSKNKKQSNSGIVPRDHLSLSESSELITSVSKVSLDECEEKEILLKFEQLSIGQNYTFPSSMNNYHRKFIHSVAEERGYGHASHGEGVDRTITISRPELEENIPTATLEPPNKSQMPTLSSSNLKKNPTKKKKKPQHLVESEDALLDSLLQQQIQCNADKCTKSTKLMGIVCEYCKKRYCFEHGSGLFHGCGRETRKGAREQFKKQSIQHKPIKDWERNLLHNKLGEKINGQRPKPDVESSKKKKKK